MDNEIRVHGDCTSRNLPSNSAERNCTRPALHTLLPLEDFKALLGLDDREDKSSRFYLLTATFTIEQYCRRSLFVRRHFERLEYTGDLLLPLREYPVREVLALYSLYHTAEPELAALVGGSIIIAAVVISALGNTQGEVESQGS